MGQDSNIEWTDTTWNPVVGCTMVSPGCAHCYAETMAKRIKGMALADIAAGRNPGRKAHYIEAINDAGRWSGKLIPVPESLADPLSWQKPRRVFVNSMSDLFHEDVPFNFIDRVFAIMALCPQHTFQILTKRPERMASFMNTLDLSFDVAVEASKIDNTVEPLQPWPLPNVWLGTSIENQATADERIPHLLRVPAAVRFLSCEPLLGPVNLTRWINPVSQVFGTLLQPPNAISWGILGGESGPGARPCDVANIRSLVQQFKAAGVPCFVKQLGSDPRCGCSRLNHAKIAQALGSTAKCMKCGFVFPRESKGGGDMSEWPEDLRVREMPKEKP